MPARWARGAIVEKGEKARKVIGDYLNNRPNTTNTHVGASLLAKNSQTPRSFRKPALSLTLFASKLAPTLGLGQAPHVDYFLGLALAFAPR
ncbi:hypothetical protein EUX53_01055 [Pseudomonas orientalis]|nr:hypothetical protein EUX53_01055 [Pseudomonas orientalis]